MPVQPQQCTTRATLGNVKAAGNRFPQLWRRLDAMEIKVIAPGTLVLECKCKKREKTKQKLSAARIARLKSPPIPLAVHRN